MKWTLTNDALPEKPCKRSYEHVDCLVKMRTGEVRILPWNCEHLCWDDEYGDDFLFHPKEPLAWMRIEDLPPVFDKAF